MIVKDYLCNIISKIYIDVIRIIEIYVYKDIRNAPRQKQMNIFALNYQMTFLINCNCKRSCDDKLNGQTGDK